jgi:hypothetical protein
MGFTWFTTDRVTPAFSFPGDNGYAKVFPVARSDGAPSFGPATFNNFLFRHILSLSETTFPE